ncbi:FAD-dependent monooxygenase, partial [Methylobacterium frigidaeris]|uniref:FAD-dependent monooxygenase n=1 Tax=Methylobacterium frigidaeris TaxID=2038277 RepID=UPI001EE08927
MTDVFIVGAGPVGLTMAAELARYGVGVRLIDHAPSAVRFQFRSPRAGAAWRMFRGHTQRGKWWLARQDANLVTQGNQFVRRPRTSDSVLAGLRAGLRP